MYVYVHTGSKMNVHKSGESPPSHPGVHNLMLTIDQGIWWSTTAGSKTHGL